MEPENSKNPTLCSVLKIAFHVAALNEANAPEELVNKVIEEMKITLDTPEKIALNSRNFNIYGFDFKKGENTEKDFFTALERAQNNSDFERYLVGGTIADPENLDDEFFGWYITSLGLYKPGTWS